LVVDGYLGSNYGQLLSESDIESLPAMLT